MNEAKHTPGPWTYDENQHDGRSKGYIRTERVLSDGKINHPAVAKAFNLFGDSEMRANARLIAAAPELEAACRAFMHEWRTVFAEDYVDSPLAEVAELCQKALAKAQGEQA